MSQVANCCYRVRVSLTGLDDERIKTSIIGVTPLVGRRVGNLMLGFVEPFLPTPPEEFVEFIGGGYHAPSVAMLANMVQWGGLRPHMDVPDAPEGAIGFPEHLLLEHVAELGFTVREKYSGYWCGRPERHYIQDVLILEKRPRRGFWFLPRRAG
jgi:hypothetical protein